MIPVATPLNYFDFAVIAAYFVLLVFIVIYITSIEKKQKESNKVSDYFLGGRNLGWMVIGASLFASNIGTEHLVGLAGAGASGDFAAAQFELFAAFSLLLLGWLFVPFYLKTGVYTMPEFLEKRYSQWSRGYLTYISVIGYILTKISVTIAAGGIIFTALLGIDFWTGSVIIVVITGVYTIIGGLKAVVYTDFMQLIVLFFGSVLLTFFGINALGGFEVLSNSVGSEYFSLWRPMTDPDFPWTGILFGAPILGVWYWCTDQFIVQRVIAAKNLDNARKGTIFAGFLKMLPLFIFVLPGIIAYALINSPESNIQFPVEDGEIKYDAALPLLTMSIMPSGLKGLVVAGLIAALMSSLSSVFNSCSTLITLDIYKRYVPLASESRLVVVGQLATVVLVVLGLAWIPLLKLIEGGLFQKLQSIQAYISPPIAAVFLIGVLTNKVNAKGAKAALLTGFVLGSSRLVLELFKSDLSGVFFYYADINFLHFAVLLFLICVLVLIAVSKWFGTNKANIESLVISGNTMSFSANKSNVWLSVLLVLSIIFLWIIFS